MLLHLQLIRRMLEHQQDVVENLPGSKPPDYNAAPSLLPKDFESLEAFKDYNDTVKDVQYHLVRLFGKHSLFWFVD